VGCYPLGPIFLSWGLNSQLSFTPLSTTYWHGL
jgi:hypothetical protein